MWSLPGEHEVPGQHVYTVQYKCTLYSTSVQCDHFLVNTRSLVSMLVTQGICFFSCIPMLVGTLDWKSNATFLDTLQCKQCGVWGGTTHGHYHLVRIERRSLLCASLWMT